MELFDIKIAQTVAKELLKIEAVKLSPNQMFTWASGIKSPIYCDNRKILSFPETRDIVKQGLAEIIKAKYSDVDVIAGVATGAIATGALVADILGKPFIYIRSEAKNHGLGNRIEGVLNAGQKVVVIEDLVSTGGSSLKAIEAIHERGNQVLAMVAIFTYNLPIALSNFKAANCELTVLSNFDVLIEFAKEQNYISNDDLQVLNSWKSNF